MSLSIGDAYMQKETNGFHVAWCIIDIENGNVNDMTSIILWECPASLLFVTSWNIWCGLMNQSKKHFVNISFEYDKRFSIQIPIL